MVVFTSEWPIAFMTTAMLPVFCNTYVPKSWRAQYRPLLRLVQHAPQRPQRVVAVGRRTLEAQCLDDIARDVVELGSGDRCRLQESPPVQVIAPAVRFHPCGFQPLRESRCEFRERRDSPHQRVGPPPWGGVVTEWLKASLGEAFNRESGATFTVFLSERQAWRAGLSSAA